MTIEEAIKLLQGHAEIILVAKNPKLNTAVKLGIEALKKVKAVREGREWVGINPLPGETDS